MVSERMKGLGTARSVIRELFEYGNQRAAVVGRENVYDFSLGNPSVPAPAAVNEEAVRLLREHASAGTTPPTSSTSPWGPPPPCAACSTA